MKHSIFLSMFTYKTQLIGEGGFSLRVASRLDYVFGMQIRSFTYKPRGFLPGTYGTVTFLALLGVRSLSILSLHCNRIPTSFVYMNTSSVYQ